MTHFSFATPRPSRRPSLTPMIDVVFLLLVFFMLAARFGTDTVLPLASATNGNAAPWQGPPRLVEIGADQVSLNGQPLPISDLPAQLSALMQNPSDPILLRPQDDATTQHLVDLLDVLRTANFTQVLIVE